MKSLSFRACKTSGSCCLRWMLMGMGAVMCVQLLIFNSVLLYVYSGLSTEISDLISGKNLFSKFMANDKVNSLLIQAKADGVFTTLLQETIERMYITHSHHKTSSRTKPLQDNGGKIVKDIGFIGMDVSHSKEATYIYERIQSRKTFPYYFFVVDIGANEGFLSSNSFNFIQWGWDAVLVDPQRNEIKTAMRNLESYVDIYNEGNQNVKFEKSAIADHDGSIKFVVTRRTQGTESHIQAKWPPSGPKSEEGDRVISVPCVTVKTLAEKHKIPKRFGLLSVDAEGAGAEILHQWLILGFTPAYIIFEHLHRQEPIGATVSKLEKHGYRYMGTRGWNLVFEHTEDGDEGE